MTTQFCHAVVPLFDGLEFHVDGNSKITRENGSYAQPRPNALSLPHIATCPGSTPSCRASCYVHGLQKNAPDVYRLYALNEMTLHRVLNTPRSIDASRALANWIVENAPWGFRWHVSGDVMSTEHAWFITQTCDLAERVEFWIYTRTLDAVHILRKAPNLVVNVSADQDNWIKAETVARQTGARICYFTNDGQFPEALAHDDVIFPDYALRGREMAQPTEHKWWKGLSNDSKRLVCPTDFFGQSEANRCGPCAKCLVSSSREAHGVRRLPVVPAADGGSS